MVAAPHDDSRPAHQLAEGGVVCAVSDIHGHLDALRAALDIVDLDGNRDATLVLLGDYVDRGPDSLGVLELIRDLQRTHGDRVVALLGNHECWMLDWLDADDADYDWLHTDVGFVTVNSFVTEQFVDRIPVGATGVEINAVIKRELRARHGELIEWLRALPLVHEMEHAIYVHAGVDEEAGDMWRAATPEHVLTEKYPASTGPFVKTVVAGHIRASELHRDRRENGVFHDGASHYYIDAAVEVSGRLNVLTYDLASGEYSWRMTPDPAGSIG